MWFAIISFALLLSGLAFVRAWMDHRGLKKQVAELEQSLKHSQQLTYMRGHLAREVAHEIKNPIAAILCSAQTLDLLISKDLAAEHRLTLRYIKEYSEHVLHLVGDFLDISMSDSGLLKTKPVVVQVKASLEAIIGLLEAKAEQKQVDLKLLCVDPDLEVKIDPRHLKQLVFNLVHNALSYTRSAGEVQVVIENDFPEKNVKISVKDNGIGIEQSKLVEIFDPYRRIDSDQASSRQGLGLGLALCNNLVRLAGGTIEVSSQLSVGSCFTIKLPLHCSTKTSLKRSSKNRESGQEQKPSLLH